MCRTIKEIVNGELGGEIYWDNPISIPKIGITSCTRNNHELCLQSLFINESIQRYLRAWGRFC